MLGEEFDAAEAAEAGLINRVVDDGSALEAALERARRLAAVPREPVELTKLLLRRPDRDAILQTLAEEAVHSAARLRSAEAQAAFERARRGSRTGPGGSATHSTETARAT